MWPTRKLKLREVKGLVQGVTELRLEPGLLAFRQKSFHCSDYRGPVLDTSVAHNDTPSPRTSQADFQSCGLVKGELNQGQETWVLIPVCSFSKYFTEHLLCASSVLGI